MPHPGLAASLAGFIERYVFNFAYGVHLVMRNNAISDARLEKQRSWHAALQELPHYVLLLSRSY